MVPVPAYADERLVASKAKVILPNRRHRQLPWEEVVGAKVVGEAVAGFGWFRNGWTRASRGESFLSLVAKNKIGILWNDWHGRRGPTTFKS